MRGQGKYATATRPDIVFLDLNMPVKDGYDVLREMKQEPTLRRTPVLILTTSDAEADVVRSYDLFASAYVVKPHTIEDYATLVEAFENFWLRVARLPQACPA
jgi:DNA-binding response OmpR family regulator